MRSKKCLALFLFGLISTALAESSCNVKGIALGNIMSGIITCNQQHLNKLLANGHVTINGGSFGFVRVHGNLTAQQAQFNDAVTLNGNAKLDSDTFMERVNATGVVNCQASIFKKTLNLTASHSSFNGCVIPTLNINNKTNKPPVIFLSNNAKVTGDVVFNGKAGIVYLTGNATIQGKVLNGVVRNS